MPCTHSKGWLNVKFKEVMQTRWNSPLGLSITLNPSITQLAFLSFSPCLLSFVFSTWVLYFGLLETEHTLTTSGPNELKCHKKELHCDTQPHTVMVCLSIAKCKIHMFTKKLIKKSKTRQQWGQHKVCYWTTEEPQPTHNGKEVHHSHCP